MGEYIFYGVKKIEDFLGGRTGKTEQGRPRLVLLKMSVMNSDLQQLVMGLLQLEQHMIADLEQLEVEQLTNAMERVQRLLKGVQKREVPMQLRKNNEWVRYVLMDAEMNGWESFVMRTTKMDKSTGEKIIEEIVMRESAQREDGMHVFADTGKEMMIGQAMCYSKVLKDRNDERYQTFLQVYNENESVQVQALRVVRKTSAQVEEEKVAVKMQKERERVAMKEERMRERSMKDAAVAAMKEERMRQKEERAQEKVAKEEEKVRQKEEKVQARIAALKQRLSDAADA